MISILFIGGAGFIGSNIVKPFVDSSKYQVYLYEPSTADLSRIAKDQKNIIIYHGYLSDISVLKRIILENKIAKIVHLVSTLLPGSSLDAYLKEYESVILPSIELIHFCSSINVQFIFFSSGGTVYGNHFSGKFKETDKLAPISYYGLSKQVIEDTILFESRLNNLGYLIIRPSNPYGPGQAIDAKQGLIAVALGKMISGLPLEIWGDGKSIRDYIYIDDLTKIFFQLVDCDNKDTILNLGSGIGYSINDIVKEINKLNNGGLIVEYMDRRTVDVSNMVLNVEKVQSIVDINYTPLSRGLELFISYVNTIKDGK